MNSFSSNEYSTEISTEALNNWQQLVEQRISLELEYAAKLAKLTKSIKAIKQCAPLNDLTKQVCVELMQCNKKHLEASRYFQTHVKESMKEYVDRENKFSNETISKSSAAALMTSMENFILFTNPVYHNKLQVPSKSDMEIANSLKITQPAEKNSGTANPISAYSLEHAELDERNNQLSEALSMLRLSPFVNNYYPSYQNRKDGKSLMENRGVVLSVDTVTSPISQSPKKLTPTTSPINSTSLSFVDAKKPGSKWPSQYDFPKKTKSTEIPFKTLPSLNINNERELTKHKLPIVKPKLAVFPSNQATASTLQLAPPPVQAIPTLKNPVNLDDKKESLLKYYATHPTITPDGFPIFAYVRALYAYKATLPSEIDLNVDDTLVVLNRQKDGWWKGLVVSPTVGRIGLFPSNYIEELEY
ncbi:Ubp4-interactor sfp47 [Schizosaccharomyces pombe]